MIDWWRRRRLTAPRVDDIHWYRSQADVPENLPRHQLAVVGYATRPKWAVLACPCGTGHVLQVNLSPRHKPSWRLEFDRERPTLDPSVDADEPARRCHFWLRDGKVRWTPDAFVSRRLARRRR